MRYRAIDLSVFPQEREVLLKNIQRYSLFKTVHHRSNLWLHHRRVLWIVEKLLPFATRTMPIDIEKTRILALVHDDAEILTGDIQAGHKIEMTKSQLRAVGQAEENAIRVLAARYPRLAHGYVYEDLLLTMQRKDSPEAQLVSYADKIDAYCETLHEIFAGNMTLLTSFAFYARAIALFPSKYPLLRNLIETSGAPFTGLDISSPTKKGEQITQKTYAGFFHPHTKKSFRKKTVRFPFYDAWREMVLTKNDREMSKLLGA